MATLWQRPPSFALALLLLAGCSKPSTTPETRSQATDLQPPATAATAPASDGFEAGSGWEYRPAADWGEIMLRSPQGLERSAGQGLVLGWGADGDLLLIRWENFQYLQRTDGIQTA